MSDRGFLWMMAVAGWLFTGFAGWGYFSEQRDRSIAESRYRALEDGAIRCTANLEYFMARCAQKDGGQ